MPKTRPDQNRWTLIHCSDETHPCESLQLTRGRWIFDRPPRRCHVACALNNASNIRRWILTRRFRCVSLSFNLSFYNSFDQRLSLNCFKPIFWRIMLHHEDRQSRFNRAIGRSTLRHVISRFWSSITIDRTLQVAPRHLCTYNLSKNQFLLWKIDF